MAHTKYHTIFERVSDLSYRVFVPCGVPASLKLEKPRLKSRSYVEGTEHPCHRPDRPRENHERAHEEQVATLMRIED